MKHHVATAYIFSPDFSKILLVKKRGSRRCMPPGGHVDYGETFEEAVLREVREETKIDINKLMRRKYAYDIDTLECDFTLRKAEENEEFVVIENIGLFHVHIDHIFCYTFPIECESYRIGTIEIEEARWYSVKELKEENFYPNVFFTINLFCGR